MTIEKSLKARREAKKGKPTFVVKESKFSARVSSRWRFPRGKHSAVRQFHRGRPPMPTPGSGSPKEVHGLDRSGLAPVVVHTLAEMKAINPAEQGAIIGSTVGMKKKMTLLKIAQEKKIRILNVADPAKKLTDLTGSLDARKKARGEKVKSRTQKTEEKKQKASKKEAEEKAQEKEKGKESVEDKMKHLEEEKKEMEKVLTQKQ